jgi:hypothetical protein
MKFTEVDKVTPGHTSSPQAAPDHFWKLLGPRLLDPSSLAIIQALVREGRSLSPVELAAQLELEVELVCEQLTAMEIEGTLRSDVSAGGSVDQATPEPRFHLSQEPALVPAPSRRHHSPAGNPRLSRAARDALFAELLLDLGQVPDLERMAESEDAEDIRECELIGARVLNALRLIQDCGIGWGRSGDADYVELSLGPGDLTPLVAERLGILTRFVESARTEWERDNREFGKFVEAREACARILDQLRPAFAELP